MAEKVATQSTSKAKEDVSKRPFGQPRYDVSHLMPTFRGPHYEFVILLPVTEQEVGSKEEIHVFTDEDMSELKKLFRDDFGGSTIPPNTQGPLVSGEWVEKKANRIVINEHARCEVYSLPTTEALDYFVKLKAGLEKHARDVRRAPQEEIVIKQSEVSFVSKNGSNYGVRANA
ncbi:MAG: hypothetical protein KGI04_04105 [Candidatus Micrarchaeota archaeon]|nr:hypothetical protein [Candidatus Micrarchaeota archaeon]